ncbi:HEAT repeat domain-containing protein [bacterium]|nr:HEAT repeat domain-containing protein [bacterium]
MKNKIKLFLITLIFIGMVIPSIAQTSRRTSSSRSSRRSSRGTFGNRDNRNDNRGEYRQAVVYDFVRTIIAGKLRHPDPKIRIQTIQTIAGSMISSSGDDSGTNEGRARNLFSIGNNDDNSDDNTTSVGAVVYIPDLYTLLSDPDPEVRDTASVALDALFGTDTTLIRLMDDTDPLVRKYATKIYSKRAFSNTNNDNNDDENNNTNDLKELLALRTFLIRLKYEKNPEVRKVITDSIEYYLRRNINEDNEDNNIGYIGGIDSAIYTYLKDPNPEIRKNAIKIISQLDYNPQVLKTLMDMLKIEKDKSVKAEIQKAIDVFIQKEKSRQEEGIEGRRR